MSHESHIRQSSLLLLPLPLLLLLLLSGEALRGCTPITATTISSSPPSLERTPA